MPSVLDTKQHVKSFIISEANGMQSRSRVTVKQTGTAIVSGTAMAKVTTAGADIGKWIPYNNAGSGGAEIAVGILYNYLPAKTGDSPAVGFDKDCEVNRFELTGLDTAGEADLLALGIKVRGASGALEISTPAL